MTMKASGIRDISRVLQISPNTILSIIKAAALAVAEPRIPKRIENLEIEEFWSFCRQKSQSALDLVWLRPRGKRIVAYVNGRRTEANCRALYEKVKRTKVSLLHTDQWASYPKVLPAKKHQ